jgi:hypothetical protein
LSVDVVVVGIVGTVTVGIVEGTVTVGIGDVSRGVEGVENGASIASISPMVRTNGSLSRVFSLIEACVANHDVR